MAVNNQLERSEKSRGGTMKISWKTFSIELNAQALRLILMLPSV